MQYLTIISLFSCFHQVSPYTCANMKFASGAWCGTVEPHYNEDLGTIKITLLYQVSHYIRVKKTHKEIPRAGTSIITVLEKAL